MKAKQSLRTRVSLLVAGACLALLACTHETASSAEGALESGVGALEVDVSEDMSRFLFDDAPLHADGMPAAGNAFVTQGYLYPHGFLDEHEGTTEEGAPAHPEDVIGEWTCRGVFVGDGAHTESGPIVVTSQVFDLYEAPGYEQGKASGKHLLTSDGYELVDVGEPIERVITGGTGAYRGGAGQQHQVLLGLNGSQGVNLRVVFDLD